jgi:predicted ArsR family transcriptional regulator
MSLDPDYKLGLDLARIFEKNYQILAREHEQALITLLFINKDCWLTRKEIVQLTNIPRTTVFDTLVRLERDELVSSDTRKDTPGKGRPKTYWKITRTGINNVLPSMQYENDSLQRQEETLLPKV